PYEIGLGWVVHLNRERFLGQEALRRERARGSRWSLVGLELVWQDLEALYDQYRLPPSLPTLASREAVPVFHNRRQVGRATSLTWSPILKKYLALATVESPYQRVGTRLAVEHTVEYRRDQVSAVVVERPFFAPERKKATL
ncbi:MAG: glycine cleavage T C-terminal barrel domain-containing protein, partial [Planctomycetota bacterium]